MKRIIILFAAQLCLLAGTYAQFRQLRPEEIAYLDKVHNALYTAIPHTYKDWATSPQDRKFTAVNFWCPDPSEGCSGTCPASLGVGDPYSLSVTEEFTMPQEQSVKLMSAAYKEIKDFNNAQQVAQALKSTNKSKLKIFIACNISAGNSEVSYCSKTPPVSIQLPVPATLALKGIRSQECPILESGRPDLKGDYYDNAVIFLGKPVASKNPDDRSDGLSGMEYTIAFDEGKTSKTLTQNIVVTFKGDAADIDEAIRLIDWNKLYALLDK